MQRSVEQLIGTDPELLSVDGLRTMLREVVVWERRLAGTKLGVLAELNRRNTWRQDGAGNAADWTATQLGCSNRSAREQNDTAEKLKAMPLTAEALASGELSAEQAAGLAAAVADNTKDAFAAEEAELVERAKKQSPEAVRRIGDRFRRDHTKAAEDEANHAAQVARRSGRIWKTADGRTALHIESDPVSAASWQPVLEATISMLWRQDRDAIRAAREAGTEAPVARTRDQLAHDAFVWLLHHGRDGVSSKAATNPTEMVVVLREDTWGTLRGETLDGTPVPGSVVERLGVSADIIRCVVDAKGVPLDWGRTRRTATRDQRLALHLLYGGCVVPGCTARFGATQAHHNIPDHQGGLTDLANLLPACIAQHHEDFDTGRLRVRINPDSTIDILTQDGRLIATRPAPSILNTTSPPGSTEQPEDSQPNREDDAPTGAPEHEPEQLTLTG